MAGRFAVGRRLERAIDFLIAPMRGRATPSPPIQRPPVPVQITVIDGQDENAPQGQLVSHHQAHPQLNPEEWQFNQTVLLRKSGVSSSALIWAAVLFTAAGAVTTRGISVVSSCCRTQP